MHEIALCHNILDTVLEHAQGQAGKIKRIRLAIGQLSCVDSAALRFGFTVIAKGSIAEQAVLEIETIPARATCHPCAQTVSVEQYYDPCPLCHEYDWTLQEGGEMKIKSMVVS